MNLLDLMVKIGIDDQASDKIGGIASGITGKLGSAAKTAGKVVVGATAAVGAGAAAMTKAAVDGYASYEQLVGGVNKLYGDASDQLQQYAQNAYRTSGLSANQYMEQATSFSASLITSLGGDQKKAAEMTDVAMRAMSDNVDTFGSDMESVQNAFMGFSKSNYTMLDNLKLGFAGTKEGAEELVKAAAAMTDEQAKLGLTVDENSLSFDNMVAAIAVMQEHMGIAGTTAKEAMSTIEGSTRMARTSWDNFLTGLGAGNEEMIRSSIGGLVQAIFGTWNDETHKREGGVVNNLIATIGRVFDSAAQYVPQLVSTLAYTIAENIGNAFGIDTSGLEDKFNDIWNTIDHFKTTVSNGFNALVQFVTGVWNSFTANLDTYGFESAGIHIQNIMGDISAFIENNVLPHADLLGQAFAMVANAIGTAADVITTIIDVFGPFVPAILGAVAAVKGFMVVQTIIGFFTSLGPAIAAAGTIVSSFGGIAGTVAALLGGWPVLLAAVVGAIVAFIATNEDAREALLNVWNAVVDFFKAIPEWFKGVFDAVKASLKDAVDYNRQRWEEFKKNTSQKWQEAKQAILNTLTNIVSDIRSKLSQAKDAVTEKWNSIKTSISDAVNNVRQKVTDGFTKVKDGIKQKLEDAVAFVRGIPNKIKNALGNLGSLLWNAGTSIINGLWNGLKSKANEMFGWVGGIAGRIAALKGPLPYDRTVLVENGIALMTGLQKGLEGGFEAKVQPYVASMADAINDSMSFTGELDGKVQATPMQQQGPTLIIESLTVRNRDDAEYFASRINDIWRRDIEGALA